MALVIVASFFPEINEGWSIAAEGWISCGRRLRCGCGRDRDSCAVESGLITNGSRQVTAKSV